MLIDYDYKLYQCLWLLPFFIFYLFLNLKCVRRQDEREGKKRQGKGKGREGLRLGFSSLQLWIKIGEGNFIIFCSYLYFKKWMRSKGG